MKIETKLQFNHDGTYTTLRESDGSVVKEGARELKEAQEACGAAPGKIDYTLSGVTAGSIAAGFTGGSAVDGVSRTADGNYTETLTAVTGNTTLRLAADAAFAGSVDNVQLWRLM